MSSSPAHIIEEEDSPLVAELGPLPDFVVDINDRPVRTDGDVWTLNLLSNDSIVRWTDLEPFLADEALFAAKHWIAESIQTSSSESAKNRFVGLVRVLKAINAEKLPLRWLHQSTFMSIRDALLPLGTLIHLFNYIRGFYYWSVDAGVPGATHYVADRIERIRISNPVVQEAVMTWDPVGGPFTEEETALIERTIAGVCGTGNSLAATMLCYELGYNALNLCLLEARDLHRFERDGDVMWQLDVPRIKKRGKQRATVRRRPISGKLGEVLSALIAEATKHFGSANPQRPIFCRRAPRESWLQTPREPLALHFTSGEISLLVRRFARDHSLVSPRTGELLVLSPRRFRYSFAQRMAEMGVPCAELVMLMDHTDERTVLTYYKNSSKVADRIEKAIEGTAGPIMSWFVGGAPKDRFATKFEVRGDMQTRNVGGLGQCGANLHCGLRPPYSCYQCAKFQPWNDIKVHTAFLTEVRQEQQRLREFAANNPAYPVPGALEPIARAAEELVTRLGKGADA